MKIQENFKHEIGEIIYCEYTFTMYFTLQCLNIFLMISSSSGFENSKRNVELAELSGTSNLK